MTDVQSSADSLREFASLMVDEVIAKVRIQLDEGQPLSLADQKHLLNQLIKDRAICTPAPSVQAGWQLVPIELTQAMLDATCATEMDDDDMRRTWAELLRTAPALTPLGIQVRAYLKESGNAD